MRQLCFAGLLWAGSALAATIYDSIPAPQPPNVPSLGYQATQTSEFGALIQFAGSSRDLSTVTVLMSDWALASTYSSLSATWNHPLTLNLYSVDNSGPNPAPGALLATRTATFAIPWRPEASAGCNGGWRAADNLCYSGFAFTVSFDFTGVTVPNQIIYGFAYNTQTYGANPLGTDGPYNSLNFGLPAGPSIGTNPFPDTAYWNTSTASNYSDGGAGGTGTFRRDTDWSGYTGGVRFEAVDAVPEPSGFLLLGSGLLALAWGGRRKR
ncbi:MAG: PEP-CTERM sorting domain-containing protein [Bryobacteraceae bacterium]|nr:PEP-CTERM sorting domain-containing protein [Bryobacteraceae bacterium]